MNKAEREARDRSIYNMLVDFLSDGASRPVAEREVARQQGLSLAVVKSAIIRHTRSAK